MPDTTPPGANDPDRFDALIDATRPRPESDVDAIWTRLRADTVDAPARSPSSANAPPARTTIRLRAHRWWIAATALAASVLIWVASGRNASPVGTASVREFVTGPGELVNIELSDGSRVTLAAASRLRVPATFGRTSREVTLIGEAIFDVTHDSLAPFRVHAAGATLTDIGTRFDVRAYDSVGTLQVAVAEGAVSISSTGTDSSAGVLVREGSTATRRDGQVSVVAGAGQASYFDWASGTLSFDHAPLAEVLRSVGRWYDLDITADARLMERRITAELIRGQPSAVLDMLSAALDARVVRNGRQVTLIRNTP